MSKIPKVFLFCKEYKDIKKIEDQGLLWHKQLSLLLSLETLPKEETNLRYILLIGIHPIAWEYFSFNIWTVFYQSELEFSDFDQKWVKSRSLFLNILELPISIA